MKSALLLGLLLLVSQAKALSIDNVFELPDAFGAGNSWYVRYQYNSEAPSFAATNMALTGKRPCYSYVEGVADTTTGSATAADFARKYDGHPLAKGEKFELARLAKGATSDVVQIFTIEQSDYAKTCQESASAGTAIRILQFEIAHDGSQVSSRGSSVYFPLATDTNCGDNTEDLKTLAKLQAQPEATLQELASHLTTDDFVRTPAAPACVSK